MNSFDNSGFGERKTYTENEKKKLIQYLVGSPLWKIYMICKTADNQYVSIDWSEKRNGFLKTIISWKYCLEKKNVFL